MQKNHWYMNSKNYNRMEHSKEILFFKHCNGQTTPEEDSLIREILSCSEESREEMEAVKKVTLLEKQIDELSRYDTKKGYDKMIQKAKKYRKHLSIRRTLLNICAAMALPLFISVTVLAYKNIEMKETVGHTCWQSVSAAPGAVISVELPDHTMAWINSGSSLSYPTRFKGGKRTVRIIGEVYFDVATDSRRPFNVITGTGLEVVAHGTQFNVEAYPDETEIETTLVDGSVSLLLGGEEKCILEPGESGTYSSDSKTLRIKQVNTEEKTAWINGKIMFRNAPIEEVFERLGRRYNTDFILHDPYNLSDRYRCRITFQDETIQQVLGYLAIAAPIRYESHSPVRQNGDVLERQKIEVWLEKR